MISLIVDKEFLNWDQSAKVLAILGELKVGGLSDYFKVDSLGHLTYTGAARPWRDELGDALALQQQGTGLSSNATENTVDFTTGANLNDYLYANIQLNHDKDLTCDIYPHLHIFQAQGNVPNMLLQYRWQIGGSAKTTAWTNLKCNTPAHTYTSGTLNQILYCQPIPVPAGAKLSDIVQFRILRDNANTSGLFSADPYTATVGILNFDVHFMINSNGSDDQFEK